MYARRFIGRKAAVVVSAFATLGVAGMLAAATASASVAPLQVNLSGASGGAAVCNPDGSFTLNNGTSGSATAALATPPSAVPGTPPSFTASAYAGGAPRWVINFNNGSFVTGYPVQLGTFNGVASTATFTGNQWGVGNGSSYMSWTAVLAAVGNPTAVTGAYIVADGGWDGETSTTITNALYDGQPLSCASTPASSASPSTSPSSKPAVPAGGVQTGGGKPVNSPWLPFGLGLAVFGLLALAGGAVALRRQRG